MENIRQAAKQLLKSFSPRIIAFNPIFVDLTGSITAGLLLSQYLWHAEMNDFEEFVMTDERIRRETKLGKYELIKAKQLLEPFVEIIRRGIPAKTYIKVSLDKIVDKLLQITSYLETRQLGLNNDLGEKVGVSQEQTFGSQVIWKPDNLLSGFQITTKEDLSEDHERISKEILSICPAEKHLDAPAVSCNAQIKEIFEYWKQKSGHSKALLIVQRRKAIAGRLKDGYTVVQIKQAIDGCLENPFNRGENDRGTSYDDIELICRNGVKLEQFLKTRATKTSENSKSSSNEQSAASGWGYATYSASHKPANIPEPPKQLTENEINTNKMRLKGIIYGVAKNISLSPALYCRNRDKDRVNAHDLAMAEASLKLINIPLGENEVR